MCMKDTMCSAVFDFRDEEGPKKILNVNYVTVSSVTQ